MLLNDPITAGANLGDFNFVLPAAVAVAAALFAARRWRLAGGWMLGIGIAASGALLGKLFFMACPGLSPDALLRSPSGHTALASAFYPGAALLVGAGLPRIYRFGLLSAGVLIAIVVGMVRLATGAHTGPEVLVGGAIGLFGLAVFLLVGAMPRPKASKALMLVPVLVVLASCTVQADHRLHAEPSIQAFAKMLSDYTHACWAAHS